MGARLPLRTIIGTKVVVVEVEFLASQPFAEICQRLPEVIRMWRKVLDTGIPAITRIPPGLEERLGLSGKWG